MPSKEHNRLADMAIKWVRNRSGSMRGALEVRLGDQYVADAVVIGAMQHRYYMSYCNHWGRDPVRLYPGQNVSLDDQHQQAIDDGCVPCSFTHIFEAKATRSDYLSTFGKNAKNTHANRMIPAGTTHWIVTDPGVCEKDEVPEFWGLLVRRGNGLREIKKPAWCGYSRDTEVVIGNTMLWKPEIMKGLHG